MVHPFVPPLDKYARLLNLCFLFLYAGSKTILDSLVEQQHSRKLIDRRVGQKGKATFIFNTGKNWIQLFILIIPKLNLYLISILKFGSFHCLAFKIGSFFRFYLQSVPGKHSADSHSISFAFMTINVCLQQRPGCCWSSLCTSIG